MSVLHAVHDERQNPDSTPVAPIGLDGMPLKTSVCDDIEQSVIRAEEIEKKLANSKVSCEKNQTSEKIKSFFFR